jgi:hypothetical protein
MNAVLLVFAIGGVLLIYILPGGSFLSVIPTAGTSDGGGDFVLASCCTTDITFLNLVAFAAPAFPAGEPISGAGIAVLVPALEFVKFFLGPFAIPLSVRAVCYPRLIVIEHPALWERLGTGFCSPSPPVRKTITPHRRAASAVIRRFTRRFSRRFGRVIAHCFSVM